MVRLWILVALCSMFFQGSLSGQNMGSLTGKVMNEENVGIEFANVVLLNVRDSSFIEGVTTTTNGLFELKMEAKGDVILRISYLGYGDLYENVRLGAGENKIGTLVLKRQNVALGEVEVVGHRPVVKIKGNSITVDIMNSLLSREPNMIDMLSKIPGMMKSKNGGLEIFGAGAPVIYIDNRKVYGISEIKSLDVKSIKQVELITNPGARYDAEGKSVLKITTLKRTDGWFVQLGATAAQSVRFSHDETIRIGFKKNKVNVSMSYSFYDMRNDSEQMQEKNARVDTLWQYVSKKESNFIQQYHAYDVNFNFEISKKQYMGIQLNGSVNPYDDYAIEKNEISKNELYYKHLDISSSYNTRADNMRLNMFYNAVWLERLNFDLNMDYAWNNNKQKQWVLENAKDVFTSSSSDYKVYSARFILGYQLGNNGSVSVGGEYAQVDGLSDLYSQNSGVQESNYTNKEIKLAGFAEYKWKKGDFSLEMGLRYENVKSDYIDLLSPENNIYRDYSELFPSLSLSYAHAGWNNSLSYTSRVNRPAFRLLNSRTYYQNEFLYQRGNPLLKPQMSHTIQWLSGYKCLSFTLGYMRTKNYIDFAFETLGDGSTIISTYQNYDMYQSLKAQLGFQYTFGCWNPVFTLNLLQPFFKTSYMGNVITNNKLGAYVRFNNMFTLPRDYMITVDYFINSGGNVGVVLFKPYQSFNLGIQKTFFNKQLEVGIRASDLFRTMVYKERMAIGYVNFEQTEDYNSRNLSLNVIWRFNQQKKSQYKGRNSAADIIRRL